MKISKVLRVLLARVLRLDPQNPARLFDFLQRSLPAAIILSVLLYEIVMEFFLQEMLPGWFRFAIDNLIFGVFGAVLAVLLLEWLRRHIEAEAEMERMAHAKERQLAAIFADSADAILLLNNDGIIQSWNRGAEMTFGYTAAETVGKHFEFLLPEELRAHGELEFIQRELEEKGFIRNYVTRRITKDGKVLSVELTRTALRNDKGEIFGSSAILRDVTERERVQAQIRGMNRYLETQVAERTRELSEANRELQLRTRELEQANEDLKQLDQLKSEFVSLVSHELRAPLANISGVFQLVLEGEGASLSLNQRELLNLANEQAERLARMVKTILDVSRIEAGEFEMASQAFDVLGLIEVVCKQCAASDPNHRYISPTVHNLPSVRADRDRVEEVLMNLLDNGAKYSRDGTAIEIRAQVKDEQMVIAVSDNGVGIPEEQLAKVFGKFYRVETDDNRQTYGYGLGLYISRKFIQAMGGEMWAESQIGRGSTFYFSLPLAGRLDLAKANSLARVA